MGTLSEQIHRPVPRVTITQAAAAQVLTLLSSGAQYTAAQIGETLGLDKSAVKNGLNYLIKTDQVFCIGYLPITNKQGKVIQVQHFSIYDRRPERAQPSLVSALAARGASATSLALDAMCRGGRSE